MASDGNRHVKVKLACPNCRSHLSIDAVERTVRLRRGALAAELQHVPDGELSAGQLRCKHQLSSSTATAAAAATIEEDSIDGRKKAAVMEIDTTLFGGLDVAMSEQEQQFVTSLMTSGRPHDLCQAATILCGIANLLRDGKLKVVSNNNHHTTTPSSSSSSSTTTTTTHSRSAVLSHGYSNAGMRTNRSYSNETESQKSKKISNYQREAEERARDRSRRPLPARMPLCVALRTGEFEKLSLLQQQQQEEEIKSNRQIQRQHAQLAMMADQNHRPPPPPTNESLPLGSRWGKWLKTGAKTLVASVTGYEGGGHNNGVNMTFVDDEWDGSIADAFARARVVSVAAARGNKGREGGVVSNEGEKGGGGGGGGGATTTTSNTTTKMMIVKGRIGPRTEIEKEGVNRILAESSRIAANDGRPPFRTKRVLVASVRGQAGKCGIMKGDVITHVNGEPFTGTANDLRATLIHAYEEQGNDGIVMLVVNAEECTAEALRLRSRVR